MKTLSKSSVMSKAWCIVKSTGISMAAALRKAWKEIKLALVHELMRSGYVLITFRKADGTVTTRLATRNAALIPVPDKPKGNGATPSAAVMAFYSETDHAWRSFKTENLLTFKAA